MSSPSVTAAPRRRQRSARLAVAAAMLGLSAVSIVAAVPTQSWLILMGAAIVAVILGAAATKITHTELLDTRRAAAKDRAEQAQEYSRITEERAAENKRFRDHMTEQLKTREQAMVELEVALAEAHQRAAEAMRARGDEARRAAQAERLNESTQTQLEQLQLVVDAANARVAELEDELDQVRVELQAERDEAEAWRKSQSA